MGYNLNKTLSLLTDSHYDYVVTSGVEGKRFQIPKPIKHKMAGIVWYNSFLPHADLTGCKLSEGMFIDCEFTHTDFQAAYIRKTRSIGNDFRSANLSKVDASHSLFYECDFDDAVVKQSRFINCDFTKSNFNNADFSESFFQGAVFRDNYFIGVDFTDCNFLQVRFFDCQYDQGTKWPQKFTIGDGLEFSESMGE
jgi:uncharacterized protein YjbI with pentapeptide repeats